MSSQLYLKWVEKKKISGLTRTQYEFAEWCLRNKDMIIRIGSFSKTFQSIAIWMKMNRELFYDEPTSDNYEI